MPNQVETNEKKVTIKKQKQTIKQIQEEELSALKKARKRMKNITEKKRHPKGGKGL